MDRLDHEEDCPGCGKTILVDQPRTDANHTSLKQWCVKYGGIAPIKVKKT